MTQRPRSPSPLLATAGSMIADASTNLITAGSRFRHSFEAAVAEISPDPQQPRQRFSDEDIAGLAATMADQGQLQPILVRPDPLDAERWIIVAGERRWRAAQRNGWTILLAIKTDGDAELVTILENLQRVDLTPVEEARALQRLIGLRNWTQDRVAVALGKSKGEISASLGILRLPAEVLDAVLTSELPLARNVLVELSRLDAAPREALLAQVGLEALTVQAIRAARQEGLELKSAAISDAPVTKPVGLRPSTKPELPAPAGEPRAPGTLEPRRIAAIVAVLEAAMREDHQLDDADRAALQRLRAAADALLAADRR